MCITLHTQHPCTHLTHTKFPCTEYLHYLRSSASSSYPYTGACTGQRLYANSPDVNQPGGEPWEMSGQMCATCWEIEAVEAAEKEAEEKDADEAKRKGKEDLLREQERRAANRRKDEDGAAQEGEEPESPSARRGTGERQNRGGAKVKQEEEQAGYLSQMDRAADIKKDKKN